MAHLRSVRVAPWMAAVLTGIFVGATGCNSILGIREARLDDGTGGSGGSSNTGGSHNTGGSGGGATGGADPGTGGSSPGECKPAQVSTLPPELVAGCVHRASCDPLGTYTISYCLTYGSQNRTSVEQCTYGATACDTVESCLGRGYLTLGEASAFCATAMGDWACEENVAIYCGGTEYSFAVDCTAVGGTCSPYAASTDSLSTPCLITTPDSSCDGSPGEFHCEDTSQYECIGGRKYGVDCAARGDTCVEAQSGQAYCLDATDSCLDEGVSTCSGTVLTSCTSDGYELQSDCADSGLSCAEEGYCRNENCTLDEVDSCAESCNGTVLQVCLGGSPLEIDCTTLGFDECRTWGSDQVHAYCYSTDADTNVARNGCLSAYDGSCDEPDACPTGTDTFDCSYYPSGGFDDSDSCEWANDGFCDEPAPCANGTDTTDCAAGE